ncbi:MAG: thermonuclease family protein [Alphaproteobacteria bacterium]|nr:thermonuclease family protein [Alphaproteobacteria bacterium]
MPRHIRPILFIIALLSTFSSQAADAPLTITKIISGDEVALSDGRTARLEGTKAPLKDTAVLEKLAAGHEAILEEISTDRYGRITAQMYVRDGKSKKWLQGELLSAGLAFVYPPTGEEQKLEAMLRAEAEARRARRGIWADPAYADIPAAEAESAYGRFAFISGTVQDAARVKNKVYLNFGEDWRKDFTVTILARDLRLFRKVKSDPLGYKGKKIRVRGWVKREGGPMIMVDHPSQIETIGRN